MELNFIEEEIPTITRTGGSGRTPEKWEDHLAPLKDHQGKSFRVWSYEKKTGALSRVQSVRNRLNEVAPKDNWTIAVRPVTVDDKPQFGVYIQYNGTFTPKEIAENAKKRQERSDRIRKAREAAEAAAPAVEAATAQVA